jgi:hypothetical protein
MTFVKVAQFALSDLFRSLARRGSRTDIAAIKNCETIILKPKKSGFLSYGIAAFWVAKPTFRAFFAKQLNPRER